MATLIKIQQGDLLEEFPIHNTGLRIGRAADNDIVIQDETVSNYHALIIVGGFTNDKANKEYWINDLRSTNRTYVNNTPVNNTPVSNADVSKADVGEARVNSTKVNNSRVNNTRVNNTRVNASVNGNEMLGHRLADKDVIRIGLSYFEFCAHHSVYLPSEAFQRTTQLHKSWIPGVFYTKK